ncbi:MAG: GNAT family N-acetyltransferase [Oscillospiraceae bacterium]|nr:GNAT family N-acetyltransferase [Oscillospiraceae bacterium]
MTMNICSEIFFCTAVKEDRRDIYRLFREMQKDIHGNRALPCDPRFLDKYFPAGRDVIFLAKASGQTVAFLSIEEHHDEADYLYLDDFCVTGAFRGRGIGTALLKKAEELARERQIPFIVLHVERTNIRAKKLYESLGYREFGGKDSRIRMIRNIG